jgi:hypothetical protein
MNSGLFAARMGCDLRAEEIVAESEEFGPNKLGRFHQKKT